MPGWRVAGVPGKCKSPQTVSRQLALGTYTSSPVRNSVIGPTRDRIWSFSAGNANPTDGGAGGGPARAQGMSVRRVETARRATPQAVVRREMGRRATARVARKEARPVPAAALSGRAAAGG